MTSNATLRPAARSAAGGERPAADARETGSPPRRGAGL
jgi:hypothetical protein